MSQCISREVETDRGLIRVSVSYKKVKNLNMRIRDDRSVSITCPRSFSLREIEEIVRKKADWITKKQILAQRRETQNLRNGGRLSYLGMERAVVAAPSNRPGVVHEGGVVTVYLRAVTPEAVEKALVSWLRSEAQSVFGKRLECVYQSWFSGQIDKPGLKIRRMKTRWGSANLKRGVITLNLSLIHAPVTLIDYVIAHELTHFIYPDHSPGYYAELEKRLPNARALKKQLNDNYSC